MLKREEFLIEIKRLFKTNNFLSVNEIANDLNIKKLKSRTTNNIYKEEELKDRIREYLDFYTKETEIFRKENSEKIFFFLKRKNNGIFEWYLSEENTIVELLIKVFQNYGSPLHLKEIETYFNNLNHNPNTSTKQSSLRARLQENTIDGKTKSLSSTFRNIEISEEKGSSRGEGIWWLSTHYENHINNEIEEIIETYKVDKEKARKIHISYENERNPKNKEIVREIWSKNSKNNLCPSCQKNWSWYKNDDRPYIEFHHIDPLGETGLDHIDNIIPLCVDCHKKAHYSKKKETFSKKLAEIRRSWN